MQEELLVASTNMADEHLWALSFYKCHVYVLQLSDLIWGLGSRLPGQGKRHGVSTVLSVRPGEHHSPVPPCRAPSVTLGLWGQFVLGWLGTAQLQSDAKVNSWGKTRLSYFLSLARFSRWNIGTTGMSLAGVSPAPLCCWWQVFLTSSSSVPWVIPQAEVQLLLMVAGLGWRGLGMLS